MPARSLTLTLSRLRRTGGPQGPTLGEMNSHLADRSLPLTILVFGLFGAVPSPGLPTGLLFGSLVVILTMQMMFGATAPALPRFLRRRHVPRRALDAVLRRAVPTLRRLERLFRPRLPALSRGPFAVLSGLLLVTMGVLLTLPIPFGNSAPGLSIVALSLGLVMRDGIGILAGWAVSLATTGAFVAILWGAGGLAAAVA